MKRDTVIIIDDDQKLLSDFTEVCSGKLQFLAVEIEELRDHIRQYNLSVVIIHAKFIADNKQFMMDIKALDAKLPIIFLSDCITTESIRQTFKLGAFDCLEKPVSKATLVDIWQQLENLHSEKSFSLQSCPIIYRAKAFYNKVQTSITQKTPHKMKAPTLTQEQAQLEVYFLGAFRAILKNSELDRWPSRRAKNIFAYLCYYHNQNHYKDILMEKFWPHLSATSARNCLNATLYSIRQLLGDDHNFIVFKDDCYSINQDVALWKDVDDFSRFWRLAQRMERQKGMHAALPIYEKAANLYQGDFMADDVYEKWPELDRENLKETYLAILERISQFYSMDGKPQEAIDMCQTILGIDNCRELVHQRLMRCYYRVGNRTRALKQFELCRQFLQDELDAPPSHTTVELYNDIKTEKLEK